MGLIRLSGRLMCRDAEQADIVRRYLPAHIDATRAEPGCLSFDVAQSTDPLIWDVRESFADRAAFQAHQDRTAGSAWGKATQGIERDFAITEEA